MAVLAITGDRSGIPVVAELHLTRNRELAQSIQFNAVNELAFALPRFSIVKFKSKRRAAQGFARRYFTADLDLARTASGGGQSEKNGETGTTKIILCLHDFSP